MGTHQAACLCKPLRLPHSSSADERYRKIRLAVQSMPYSRTYLKDIKKKNGINTLAHFLQLKSKPLRFRSDLQNIAQCHKKILVYSFSLIDTYRHLVNTAINSCYLMINLDENPLKHQWQIWRYNDLRHFYAKGTTVPSGKKMDPICMCRYIMLVVSKVWYETNDRMAISEDWLWPFKVSNLIKVVGNLLLLLHLSSALFSWIELAI